MEPILGTNIRKHRLDRKLTLKQASELSKVKVTTFSAIEQGRIKTPSLQTIRSIASAFNVPLEYLLEDSRHAPLFYKGDMKGVVLFDFKKEGLTLLSYTPLMKELFIGKGILKPKKTLDLKCFPRLTFLFVEVIFGKLEVKWENQAFLVSEGENLSLRSSDKKIIQNPFQLKDTSFLIVSNPSLVSANLESQTPLI